MIVKTRVKRISDGKLGVVVNDPFGCCSEDEVPVIFDGVSYFEGTPEYALENVDYVITTPEHKKCGAGLEAECCIYLTCGPSGFVCERFGSLHYTLQFKTMVAKRHPVEPYPECMIHED